MGKLFILLTILLIPNWVLGSESENNARQELSALYLQRGIKAYQDGDYQKAAESYAESISYWPSVRASGNLCNLYLYGQGVEKNYATAIRLCKDAAEYDDAHSLIMLGEIYLLGKGVAKDLKIAEEYYQKGADLGHAHGQFMLASLLQKKSPTETKYYLEKAAENGHAEAKKVLINSNKHYQNQLKNRE